MATRAVRSFAITLAIAIAIIGPPASGFVTNRTYVVTTPLGIQDKDGKQNEPNITTSVLSSEVTISISHDEATTQKSTENQVKNEKTHNAKTAMEITTTTENIKIPTITSDTVEVFDSVEDVTETKNNVKYTENDIDFSQRVISLPKKTPPTTTRNPKNINVVTAMTTMKDQVATESESTKDQSTQTILGDTVTSTLNEMPTTSDTPNTSVKQAITETNTYDTPTTSIEPAVTKAVDTPTTSFMSAVPKTEANVISPNPTSLIITEKSFPSTILSENTRTEASTKVLSYSEMTDTTMYIPNTLIIEPLRKNYTTIVRKRTTSAEPAQLTTEDEHMKAETSNTFMSYEKPEVTPELSKKATIGFHTSTNLPIISAEDTGKTTALQPSVDTIIRSLNSIETTEIKGTATVQTKRAGYLDNSEKSTRKSSESNNQAIEEIRNGIGNDTKTTEKVTLSTKGSSSESQSQLSEDALREEFLEEEAIKNRQENMNRYGSEGDISTSTSDTLSVQPIEQAPERARTTLYTVSPNYKPMKKIDVQPAKPFVRDPDDNSWRNESIGSLGIVFKPNNSSISFKEVLKNKTQTELNSLQEKGARDDDVPDLRVRLEKIAEVRKTKKKKTNKDGEVIYTDYEEGGSAEGNYTGKGEPIFSPLSPSDIFKFTTTSDPFADFKPTAPMTAAKEEGDDRGSDPSALNALTTRAPSPGLFNIAEYYDTTDEYDADYVRLPKLDLKKFTINPRTTRPPATSAPGLPTRPMRPEFPDRRPTVQYFPPRTPPRGGNRVNADFERKVNSLTFESPLRPRPQPHFATIPPETIATGTPAGPELEGGAGPRAPATPPDLVLYTPVKDFYEEGAGGGTGGSTGEGGGAGGGAGGSTGEGGDAGAGGGAAGSPPPHRGSYLIKHYRDFLQAAAHDEDADRAPFAHLAPDVEAQLRRGALARAVADFNRHSARHRLDFPVLYNSSVLHRAGAGGRALVRRPAGEGAATRAAAARACAACELTVELSPAYELHYYVPEQEEREQTEPRAASAGPAPPAPQFATQVTQYEPNAAPFEPHAAQFAPPVAQFASHSAQFASHSAQFAPHSAQFAPPSAQFAPHAGRFPAPAPLAPHGAL